jgi:hypothetical protein
LRHGKHIKQALSGNYVATVPHPTEWQHIEREIDAALYLYAGALDERA